MADGSRGRVRNDQEAMAAESGIVSLHPYPHRKWGGCGGGGREMSESDYKPLKLAPAEIFPPTKLSSQGFITFPNCPSMGETQIQIHEPRGALFHSHHNRCCVSIPGDSIDVSFTFHDLQNQTQAMSGITISSDVLL